MMNRRGKSDSAIVALAIVVRANFAELARQWRDLARQHQYLENPLPDSN